MKPIPLVMSFASNCPARRLENDFGLLHQGQPARPEPGGTDPRSGLPHPTSRCTGQNGNGNGGISFPKSRYSEEKIDLN